MNQRHNRRGPRAGARLLATALSWLLAIAACATPITSEERESLLAQADADLLAGRLDAAESGFARVLDSDPNDPRAHAGAGLARLRHGRADAALASFDAALKASPDDPHYNFLRARALGSLGRLDEAIQAADETLSRDPQSSQAVILLMNLLVEAERIPQATDVARQAVKEWPTDAGVLLKAGQVLVSIGAPLEALECFEAVRRLRPWEQDPLEGSIESLRRAGRIEEARALMPRLRELKVKAETLETLRRDAVGSQTAPGPSRAYIAELFAQQRFEDGLRETRAFLAQFPDAPLEGLESGDGARGGGLLIQAADAAARLGDARTARELLGLAATKGGSSDVDDLALARIHDMLGEHQRAADIFSRHLDGSPGSVEALLGLGRARLALGQVDAARDPIDKAIAAEPSRADVRAALGLLLLKKGDLGGAEAALRRALGIDPKDPDALLGTGVLSHQRGDLRQAETSLRAALAERPGDPTAKGVLAFVLSDLGRCEEAIPIFSEALEQGSNDVGVHAGLVRCYEKTGRKEDADRARKAAVDALGEPQ